MVSGREPLQTAPSRNGGAGGENIEDFLRGIRNFEIEPFFFFTMPRYFILDRLAVLFSALALPCALPSLPGTFDCLWVLTRRSPAPDARLAGRSRRLLENLTEKSVPFFRSPCCAFGGKNGIRFGSALRVMRKTRNAAVRALPRNRILRCDLSAWRMEGPQASVRPRSDSGHRHGYSYADKGAHTAGAPHQVDGLRSRRRAHAGAPA